MKINEIKINSKSNKRFNVDYFNKKFNHISNIIAIKENSKYLIIRQIIFLLILIEF